MPEIERFDILVIGSGGAGKHLTSTMAQASPNCRCGAEIYWRIVSEHCVLAKQERDSQRKSELVRSSRHGIRHSSRISVYGHERRPESQAQDGRPLQTSEKLTLIRLPLLTGQPGFGVQRAGFCAHFAPDFCEIGADFPDEI